MRGTLKWGALGAFIALSFLPAVPVAECDVADQAALLVFEIHIEGDVLLEGQSAYMITCLHNRGDSGITDVSPVSPRVGYFRMELLRRDTGKRIKVRMPVGPPRGAPGVTLTPDRVLCEVSDLNVYFGGVSQDSSSLSERLGSAYLPRGDYLLKWAYDLHTSDPNQVPFRGEAPFSVRALSSDRKEQSLVQEFLRGLPRVGIDHGLLHAYARAWLPQFYGSKFFLQVYMATGTLLSDLDFDAILDGVARAGAPPERQAALLALRLSMTDLRNQFTPEWKEHTRGRVAHQLERDVLSIEPRKPAKR